MVLDSLRRNNIVSQLLGDPRSHHLAKTKAPAHGLGDSLLVGESHKNSRLMAYQTSDDGGPFKEAPENINCLPQTILALRYVHDEGGTRPGQVEVSIRAVELSGLSLMKAGSTTSIGGVVGRVPVLAPVEDCFWP